MSYLSEFTETQQERLFEDWDAAEPKTSEDTKYGISTKDLFSRYTYYSKLIDDKRLWERDCNQQVVDAKASSADTLVTEIDELEIPVHVIKKKASSSVAPTKGATVSTLACLPLRIEDIFRIEPVERLTNQFAVFGLPFRLVTFFGRITRVVKNEKWNQRHGLYTVDDGSGHILVNYNHLQRECKDTFTELAQVERGFKEKRNRTSSLIGKISDDIRKLMNLSRNQLQLKINYFSRGDMTLVLGIPFRDKLTQTRIFGYEMYARSNSNCDFEIHFKNILFNAYLNKYFASKR